MKKTPKMPAPSAAARRPLARVAQRVLNRALSRLDLGVRSVDELGALDEALRFHYYWYNAHKKRDIRELDGFGRLAAQTIEQGRTYLSFDRLYTLWQGVSRLRDHASVVVEVGAFKGGSARFTAEALRLHDRTNRFFVFDTFEGHAVVDESVDGKHRVGKQFRATSLERVAKYLSAHDNVQVVKGDFRETATRLEDVGPIGLAHVDVDVYPVTRFCLEFLADRMTTGGTIVVDDYGFKKTRGACKAVEEFAASRPDFCRMHLLTGQGILIRLERQTAGGAD